VAPIILYSAKENRLVTISGLGTWPKALPRDYFQKNHSGKIPAGVERTIVPAAPDAWLTALELFGTMSFGEIAQGAPMLARRGCPPAPLTAEIIAEHEAHCRRSPSKFPFCLPNGKPPLAGDVFVQADLARTPQHMVDEEKARAPRGRIA